MSLFRGPHGPKFRMLGRCPSDAWSMPLRYPGDRRPPLVSEPIWSFFGCPLPSAPAPMPGMTINNIAIFHVFPVFSERYYPLFRLLGRCLSDAGAIPGGSEITPSICVVLVLFWMPPTTASMPGDNHQTKTNNP